jgi:hypothetical protein
MEDFQNRYGISTSIYEYCRYKNVPIPKEMNEDQVEATTHMPILERMLNERLRNLNEILTISRNEKTFPEKNPNLRKVTSYWEFSDDKQLRDFRMNQHCRKPQSDFEEEDEDENELDEINIYNEEGELIDKEEVPIEKEEERKKEKKKNRTIRIYEKAKDKENKENDEEEDEDEEEEMD